MEYILCAAIHYDDGKQHTHQPKNILSGFVLCGRRHHNVIHNYAILTDRYTGPLDEQGFMTSENRFVDRKEAVKIAFAAGQIKQESKPLLYSEDLY